MSVERWASRAGFQKAFRVGRGVSCVWLLVLCGVDRATAAWGPFVGTEVRGVRENDRFLLDPKPEENIKGEWHGNSGSRWSELHRSWEADGEFELQAAVAVMTFGLSPVPWGTLSVSAGIGPATVRNRVAETFVFKSTDVSRYNPTWADEKTAYMEIRERRIGLLESTGYEHIVELKARLAWPRSGPFIQGEYSVTDLPDTRNTAADFLHGGLYRWITANLNDKYFVGVTSFTSRQSAATIACGWQTSRGQVRLAYKTYTRDAMWHLFAGATEDLYTFRESHDFSYRVTRAVWEPSLSVCVWRGLGVTGWLRTSDFSVVDGFGASLHVGPRI